MDLDRIKKFIRKYPTPYVYNIEHLIDICEAFDALCQRKNQVNQDKQTKAHNEYFKLLAEYEQAKLEWKEQMAQHHRLYYIEHPAPVPEKPKLT